MIINLKVKQKREGSLEHFRLMKAKKTSASFDMLLLACFNLRSYRYIFSSILVFSKHLGCNIMYIFVHGGTLTNL